MIVKRRTYLDVPLPTFDAIDELVALEVVFLLFRHVRTGEDVVVHRIDHEPCRVELVHPPHSVLADETDDIVLTRASRYSRAARRLPTARGDGHP